MLQNIKFCLLVTLAVATPSWLSAAYDGIAPRPEEVESVLERLREPLSEFETVIDALNQNFAPGAQFRNREARIALQAGLGISRKLSFSITTSAGLGWHSNPFYHQPHFRFGFSEERVVGVGLFLTAALQRFWQPKGDAQSETYNRERVRFSGGLGPATAIEDAFLLPLGQGDYGEAALGLGAGFMVSRPIEWYDFYFPLSPARPTAVGRSALNLYRLLYQIREQLYFGEYYRANEYIDEFLSQWQLSPLRQMRTQEMKDHPLPLSGHPLGNYENVIDTALKFPQIVKPSALRACHGFLRAIGKR